MASAGTILYYSVHQILEFDEVRLFRSLGWDVFVLGALERFGCNEKSRPFLNLSESENLLYTKFEEFGGNFDYITKHCSIPQVFIEYIDVVIVMHDFGFIERQWDVLRSKKVILRTIGQGIGLYEDQINRLVEQGVILIRYSEKECLSGNCAGGIVINFCKEAADFPAWSGQCATVVSFVQNFAKRFPIEYLDFCEITQGMPVMLGGGGNQESPAYIGHVEVSKQIEILSEARVYLYASTLEYPYTLGLIEAWLSGIPLVVYAPPTRSTSAFQMDALIQNGVDGYVCHNILDARSILLSLLGSRDLAEQIGTRGRARATAIFSYVACGYRWSTLLDTLMRSRAELTKPKKISPRLSQWERKIFSQFGEDGVIEKILSDLEINVGAFLEIGVGPHDNVSYSLPLEGNCIALRSRGWSGVLLDRQKLPAHYEVRQELVTALNINQIISKHMPATEIDVFSMDVDGQEFWIWMSMLALPKIVVLDYNGSISPTVSVSVLFEENFRWDGTNYKGASLLALTRLARSKGYVLVWANGVNAIFVRKEIILNAESFLFEEIYKANRQLPPENPILLWVDI